MGGSFLSLKNDLPRSGFRKNKSTEHFGEGDLMTMTKDNPEALVEDVMARVRESLNNNDYNLMAKI